MGGEHSSKYSKKKPGSVDKWSRKSIPSITYIRKEWMRDSYDFFCLLRKFSTQNAAMLLYFKRCTAVAKELQLSQKAGDFPKFLNGGWFYCPTCVLSADTKFKPHRANGIFLELRKEGWVESKLIGQRRYIRVNEKRIKEATENA